MYGYHRVMSWDPYPLHTVCANSDLDTQSPDENQLNSRVQANLSKIQALIVNGASVNQLDYSSRTPLHRACGSYFTSLPIVKLLIQFGANVHYKDWMGRTPLHCACDNLRKISKSIIELLIASGANVNHQDERGKTPLHYICSSSTGEDSDAVIPDIVKFLVESGADVNYYCEHGIPPLQYVCIYWPDDPELMTKLLNYGARVTTELFQYPEFVYVYESYIQEKFIHTIHALQRQIPDDLIEMILDDIAAIGS